MAPISSNFYRERYEKDQKYYTIYESFSPNYKERAVTGKFYSKYEPDLEKVDPQLLETIKKKVYNGPRDKNEWPETENQWYGWFTTPFVEINRSDRRFYFPVIVSEMTRHGLKLKQDKNDKSKFTGVPFKL